MRHWIVPLLVLTALGCATAALMWVGVFPSPAGFPRQGENLRASFPVATPVRTEPFTAARAEALADDLTCGAADRVGSAVVLPAGTQTPSGFVAEMAALRDLTFDVSTFQAHEDGTGTVRAEIVDREGKSKTWTAYVAWQDGRWKLTATIPQAGPTASATATAPKQP